MKLYGRKCEPRCCVCPFIFDVDCVLCASSSVTLALPSRNGDGDGDGDDDNIVCILFATYILYNQMLVNPHFPCSIQAHTHKHISHLMVRHGFLSVSHRRNGNQFSLSLMWYGVWVSLCVCGCVCIRGSLKMRFIEQYDSDRPPPTTYTHTHAQSRKSSFETREIR